MSEETATLQSLMRLLFLLACALVAPLAVAQNPAATSKSASTSAEDDAAIRDLVRRYVNARDQRDPKAIDALFTEDADQYTTSGEWRRGRAQIVPGALASSARNSGRRDITVETVRYVTKDVAIADGPYTITASETGPARTMWTTLVVKREAGGWRIAAIRNMAPTGPAPAVR